MAPQGKGLEKGGKNTIFFNQIVNELKLKQICFRRYVCYLKFLKQSIFLSANDSKPKH